MKKNLSRSFRKHQRSLLPGLVAFVAVAGLGIYVLQSSFAATETVSAEAESNLPNGSTATIVDDQDASGGKYLQFAGIGTDPNPDPNPDPGGTNSLEPGGGIIPASVSLLHDGSIGPDGLDAHWVRDQGRVEDASDGPGHEHVMRAISSGRSEVIAPDTLWSFDKPEGEGPIREGSEWWMAFSVKFPDRPTDSDWALVWQVHAGYPYPDGSPPVAMTFDPDTFMIGNNRAHLNDGGWSQDIGPLPIGEWKDYVVHIKFSESASNGHVKVWEDGQSKVDTSGQTLATGGSGNSFFKYGVYGGDGTTVLHDNMKIYTP